MWGLDVLSHVLLAILMDNISRRRLKLKAAASIPGGGGGFPLPPTRDFDVWWRVVSLCWPSPDPV